MHIKIINVNIIIFLNIDKHIILNGIRKIGQGGETTVFLNNYY